MPLSPLPGHIHLSSASPEHHLLFLHFFCTGHYMVGGGQPVSVTCDSMAFSSRHMGLQIQAAGHPHRTCPLRQKRSEDQKRPRALGKKMVEGEQEQVERPLWEVPELGLPHSWPGRLGLRPCSMPQPLAKSGV
jgi:hypothetical protein